MKKVLFAWSVVAMFCLAGCGSGHGQHPPAGHFSTDKSVSGPLMVFAAASLTDAFTSIGNQFHRHFPLCNVSFNFAGTQTLLTQLKNGAEADVFVSANVIKMRDALDADLVVHPQGFASNRVCVALPPNQKKIRSLHDLAKPGCRIAIALPECPIGRYTCKVFEKLAASGEYGPDFVKKLRANVVVEETNVKRVLARIELGEVDAGFVYTSDQKAISGRGVGRLSIPDRYNVIAAYPIAVCSRAKNKNAAQAFVDFVLSPTGQSILTAYGFGPASAAACDELCRPKKSAPK